MKRMDMFLIANLLILVLVVGQAHSAEGVRVNPVQAIFEACQKGDIKTVKSLLDGDKTLVSAKNYNGVMPLHRAALFGQAAVVELLIERGADKNAKDDHFGDTPLHKAAWNGHKEAAKMLVSKGANINAKNNDGRTALDLAKARGKNEVVKFLENTIKEKSDAGQ